MSENLKVFPSNESEALAMLYIQKQDLSGLSPAQIYDKYYDAYKEIRKHKMGKKNTTTIMNSPI